MRQVKKTTNEKKQEGRSLWSLLWNMKRGEHKSKYERTRRSLYVRFSSTSPSPGNHLIMDKLVCRGDTLPLPLSLLKKMNCFYLMHSLHYTHFSSTELPVAYMVLILITALRGVSHWETVTKQRSVSVGSMAQWGLEPGPPGSQSNVITIILYQI